MKVKAALSNKTCGNKHESRCTHSVGKSSSTFKLLSNVNEHMFTCAKVKEQIKASVTYQKK